MEKKSAHATEQDRPDVAASREAWFAAQPDLDPERLIFIDETGLSTRMARLRGRCARGQRLRSGIPHGHWLTTTFVAGLRLSGMSAPMVLDGPMTRDWFLAYVEQVLAPTLRPGDTVILDNLPAHKGAAIQAAIEARGARLRFLPPYSPEPKDRVATSIQSRWLSQSSRRCCAKRPSARLIGSGLSSAICSTPSPQPSAQTTSLPPVTTRSKWKPL